MHSNYDSGTLLGETKVVKDDGYNHSLKLVKLFNQPKVSNAYLFLFSFIIDSPVKLKLSLNIRAR